MRISVLILVSLAVNLILAAVLFRPGHGAASARPVAAASENFSGDTATLATESSLRPSENSATTAAGGKISWRDLQAAELKKFIANLRAVNCPEETVEDLVMAEVNRRFTAKTRSFWNNPDNENAYWKPYQRRQDPEKAKQNRERYKFYQSSQKEKTALLTELFGFDVEKARMKEEGYDPEDNWNYGAGNLSFLPEAKRDAVSKYLEDYQEKEQALYAEFSGGWGPEERAKQKQLEQEKIAGLAQFLTPQEAREYELRNSQTAQQITSDLHGVDLTREQYEALFDIRKKYGESILNFGDAGNTPEKIQQIAQNKKDMETEIATAVGTDKSAELERAQDYQYQQLASLTRHNDLPADTAPKIYDFKQTAEKAVEALRANQDLTPEQRQTALAQIRTETEASVKTALGDKLFKRYQNNGGWWINQLAPTPAQRVNSVISR